MSARSRSYIDKTSASNVYRCVDMYEKNRIAGSMCDQSAKNPQNANLNAVIIAAQNVPFYK